MGKYFPTSARHAKAQEFLELRQGTMTIHDYVARFTELVRFEDDYVATNAAKVRKFKDMDSMVSTTLIIEREVDNAHSIRDASASDKKMGSQASSSSSRNKQRTSIPRGF